MTAATLHKPRGPETDRETAEAVVVLHDVDWEGYESILKIRGERSAPRMVYLDGSLFLMSPSYPHEQLAERLDWLVKTILVELDVPCAPSGSTTFRRGSKQGGAEPDHSYYLASAPGIRGKEAIDLDVDPPPDLVIEAVRTHKADAAVEVYRRFGVPEVWVAGRRGLTILVLQPSGGYEPAQTSRALPVSAAEIHEWATREIEGSETAWMKAVQRWVRETVAPRLNASPSNPD